MVLGFLQVKKQKIVQFILYYFLGINLLEFMFCLGFQIIVILIVICTGFFLGFRCLVICFQKVYVGFLSIFYLGFIFIFVLRFCLFLYRKLFFIVIYFVLCGRIKNIVILYLCLQFRYCFLFSQGIFRQRNYILFYFVNLVNVYI